jgi:hypothetical protein
LIARALLISLLAVLCGFMPGCGQQMELIAVEVTPTSPNIVGIGGTEQFQVMAKYNNTESGDVTVKATYQIDPPDGLVPLAPPQALSINARGLMKAVDAACTWTKSGTDEKPVYGTSPYKLTVTFEGKQAVAFVSVASLAGCEYPDPTKLNTIIVNPN